MKMSISLLLVLIMFIITITYTYNNDTSMFLFILLLITVFFYVYELVEYKLEVLIDPIQRVEKVYANIINKLISGGKNLENLFDDYKGKISSKINTSVEKIGGNFNEFNELNKFNEFNELLNDIDGNYLRNLVNN